MPLILQLVHRLTQRPELPVADGIALQTYRGPDDIAAWLDLRRQAFAGGRVVVRPWTADDFAAEFTTQPWWRPEHLWFAEIGSTGVPPSVVGAVALVVREARGQVRPALHWLIVAPPWRRRGVGRLLVARAEQACWDVGQRTVFAETHRDWTSAAACYQALGYEATRPDAGDS